MYDKNCEVKPPPSPTIILLREPPPPLREGVKKPIESVIMIIPGRGWGGSVGGDHTLLGFFFNAPNLVVWLY